MGDHLLASLLANERDPLEAIKLDQSEVASGWFVNSVEHAEHFLKTGKRIARLECGHFTLTEALHRAKCRRCGEMIRSGYDYDGFRNHGLADTFVWPQDPFALVHEPKRDGGESVAAWFNPF